MAAQPHCRILFIVDPREVIPQMFQLVACVLILCLDATKTTTDFPINLTFVLTKKEIVASNMHPPGVYLEIGNVRSVSLVGHVYNGFLFV